MALLASFEQGVTARWWRCYVLDVATGRFLRHVVRADVATGLVVRDLTDAHGRFLRLPCGGVATETLTGQAVLIWSEPHPRHGPSALQLTSLAAGSDAHARQCAPCAPCVPCDQPRRWTDDARPARDAEIERRRLDRETIAQIAAALGLTPSVVGSVLWRRGFHPSSPAHARAALAAAIAAADPARLAA